MYNLLIIGQFYVLTKNNNISVFFFFIRIFLEQTYYCYDRGEALAVM